MNGKSFRQTYKPEFRQEVRLKIVKNILKEKYNMNLTEKDVDNVLEADNEYLNMAIDLPDCDIDDNIIEEVNKEMIAKYGDDISKWKR